ncbi:MAG: hypothetical protein M0R22_00095 [Dehalococcoidia bacterium]|nr:hypothetical protein [Dehalococcoidia bacterium]
MSEAVHELKKIDVAIEKELLESRDVVTTLLKQRESVIRGACEPHEEGQAELILELATRRAPASFKMNEAYRHVRDSMGPSVKPNQVTAWLAKLVKQEKLIKRGRGEYALA